LQSFMLIALLFLKLLKQVSCCGPTRPPSPGRVKTLSNIEIKAVQSFT